MALSEKNKVDDGLSVSSALEYVPHGYGDIAPCELPISEELQLRLSTWAAIYDETVDADYPPNSGFKIEDGAVVYEFSATPEQFKDSALFTRPTPPYTTHPAG